MTVTLKLQVAVRFAASVAVQVTAVVPFWKTDPDAGLHATVTAEQMSLALGFGKVTTAEHLPGSFERTMSAGQVMLGGVVSCTVTVVEHVAVAVPSFTAKLTVNTPVPENCTVGLGPVAVPPTKGPVQLKVIALQSGSDDALPSKATLVFAPAHSAA